MERRCSRWPRCAVRSPKSAYSGVPSKGFVPNGALKLQAGKMYGAALDDLTAVNCSVHRQAAANIVDFSRMIEPPCEAGLGSRCTGPK